MREIRWDSRTPKAVLRITPAYAGNTASAADRGLLPRDHPRLCGKYDMGQNVIDNELGSPPPMREILFSDSFPDPPYWDHPRLCGKYSKVTILVPVLTGSPPPMREILSDFRSVTRSVRITPAYAGNTLAQKENLQLNKDHPRLCGKYTCRFTRLRYL